MSISLLGKETKTMIKEKCYSKKLIKVIRSSDALHL